MKKFIFLIIASMLIIVFTPQQIRKSLEAYNPIKNGTQSSESDNTRPPVEASVDTPEPALSESSEPEPQNPSTSEPDSESVWTEPEPSISEPATSPSIQDHGNNIPAEYQALSYFKPELTDRYIAYRKANPEYDYEKVIAYVNIGIDKPFYSIIHSIEDTHSTKVLVNKYHKLPDDFAPELVQIPSSMCAPGMGNQYLRKDAKVAFEKMHFDAKELGLNITAYGTYRNIRLQHDIWNSKVISGRTVEDVDRLNSRGGHSEHHTGLAIDVIRNNYTVLNSEEYLWYKDNAHNYGFIIRYPEGKEHITGYSYEPWHLRYLGVELATDVYNSGLTYEEYYVMNIE